MLAKNVKSLYFYLNKNLKKAEKIFINFISTISLIATYFFGVGITSLVAKLVGKKFLEKSINKSQWSTVDYTKKINKKMY